ncbi:MAG: Protein translocase subunit SecF [Parcubacteria group bacterium GW2011_GWF2_38_76]|nr:MAG: Protein translocase subunit SecF [Parcubacteria group bacterium GW2011_GWF2_38_76]HBM45523.1 protein translocase subunit SecF [Patescibacteria group bacterium]
MFIVKHKNFFIGLSLVMFLLSIFSIFNYGLNLGIDFKGGSIMEIEYKEEVPDITLIKEAIKTVEIGDIIVQETGDKGLLIKMRDLKEDERLKVVKALAINGATFEEKRFDSIGPVIGDEMSRKAIIAIVLVCIMIALFIAFAFRHVSKPVSSFKYGLAALIALLHDTVIPTGIMAYMGAKYGTEIDLLFVSALLAILGFSIHDTIVVFDRVRENLKNKISKSFEETIGLSLNQTFVRSMNTSATTIFTLLALYFFGGESTKIFALVLSIGIFFGTYSSVFLASPILILMEEFQGKKK